MVSKHLFMALTILAIAISGCEEKKEPYYGYTVEEIPIFNAHFDGTFQLNGENITDYSPGILIKDTLLTPSTFTFGFGIYERRGKRWFETFSFGASTPLGDTAFFVSSQYYQKLPNMGLTLVNGDALLCDWINDSSGSVYSARMDNNSYVVDLHGRVINKTCGHPGGEVDTFNVVVKGFFTLVE